MKTKLKKLKIKKNILNYSINTKNITKKHRLLLENKNFMNNQNYVLSDFSESKVYNKYKKTFFNKWHYTFLFTLSLYLIPIFWILSEKYNYLNLMNTGLYLLFFIIFSPLIYILIKGFLNYLLYKKFKINFISKKYIFRKKIRNRVYRNDYIIFKK